MLSTQIFKLYCESLKLEPLIWALSEPTQEDLGWIEKECQNKSDFDPKGFRMQMCDDWKSGKANLVCWVSHNYKVLVISYGDDKPTPSWSIVLQSFCPAQRVLWLAHPETRQFPHHGEKPGPLSVNGGYTYACTNNSIVIYRKEEALRVLIHELLHATCTDNRDDHLPVMEAKTEAWAEVIYCCVLARGNLAKALRLWKLQSAWIVAQTKKLINNHSVNDASDYAWRYTVGKAEYLRQWGLIGEKEETTIPITTSLTSLRIHE